MSFVGQPSMRPDPNVRGNLFVFMAVYKGWSFLSWSPVLPRTLLIPVTNLNLGPFTLFAWKFKQTVVFKILKSSILKFLIETFNLFGLRNLNQDFLFSFVVFK